MDTGYGSWISETSAGLKSTSKVVFRTSQTKIEEEGDLGASPEVPDGPDGHAFSLPSDDLLISGCSDSRAVPTPDRSARAMWPDLIRR